MIVVHLQSFWPEFWNNESFFQTCLFPGTVSQATDATHGPFVDNPNPNLVINKRNAIPSAQVN